jgi:hypothetical protein
VLVRLLVAGSVIFTGLMLLCASLPSLLSDLTEKEKSLGQLVLLESLKVARSVLAVSLVSDASLLSEPPGDE